MFMIPTIVSLIEVVLVLVSNLMLIALLVFFAGLVLVPALLVVVYMTVVERKTLCNLAELRLVSVFMTEHAAVVFVFFFLAEYGSIVLMCILTSLLFLGGYLPVYSLTLVLKSSTMIYVFIWARVLFPSIRFDQLMAFCWTVYLHIIFAIIIFVPCILFSFDIFPVSINLF